MTYYQYQNRPSDFLNYNCLDFNEYHGEVAPSTVAVLKNSIEFLKYYPNVDDPSLILEISKTINAPVENLALANGADEALFHILLINKLNKIYDKVHVYFSPTYDHFLHFAEKLGFTVSKSDSKSEKSEFKNKIIYISFPNNPTGEEISPETLENDIKISENSLWILDTTYLFYSHYKIDDYIQRLLAYKNVVIVMSFSKSFPMAGLRMAFVLSANSKIIHYFQKDYNQKTVGTFSRLIALDCLRNKSFYEDQRNQIWNNRTRLAQLFQKISSEKGLSLKVPSLDSKGGNFFLMEGVLEDRNLFVKFLYSVKIIVRCKQAWNFLRVTSVSDVLFNKIEQTLKSSF